MPRATITTAKKERSEEEGEGEGRKYCNILQRTATHCNSLQPRMVLLRERWLGVQQVAAHVCLLREECGKICPTAFQYAFLDVWEGCLQMCGTRRKQNKFLENVFKSKANLYFHILAPMMVPEVLLSLSFLRAVSFCTPHCNTHATHCNTVSHQKKINAFAVDAANWRPMKDLVLS